MIPQYAFYVYLKEYNSGYNKHTCTPIIIAALFTIAKLRNQPRWPTTGKWIKKMWKFYTMEFYSATKKKELLLFVGKCMELENIILSDVNQVQKTKVHICGTETQ
jgi:hypothetical protein